jgi:NAD(P)-dependent dehydrogenase (short-subunit alcohol dehydrogenase family)
MRAATPGTVCAPLLVVAERFAGKVCLVTGGGSGIGRATCVRFAAEGARVLVADINLEGGEETARMVREGGAQSGEAVAVRCDVSRGEDVRTAIGTAVERWGRLDVVVNNAAMMTFDPIANLKEDDWERVLAVNLRSVFLFSKYALQHLQPGGAIVNTSSVHAHQTTPNVVPYAASKAAMESFTRGLSRELEGRLIRVNCVAPGAVDTPMLWSNPNVKSGKEKIEGAIGKPEDIAAVIAFLASDEARFINGTTVVVDGGRLDIL